MNGRIVTIKLFRITREEAMARSNVYISGFTYCVLFKRLLEEKNYVGKVGFGRNKDYYYFSNWKDKNTKQVIGYISEKLDYYDAEGELDDNCIKERFAKEDCLFLFDLFVSVIEIANGLNIHLLGEGKKDGYEDYSREYLKRVLKNVYCADWADYGTIYVMKNCGYYKVGKACIGSKRYGEYTKLPEEPEYLIKRNIFCYSSVEKIIHEMFKDKRQRGGRCEWFCLNEEDLKKIDMVLDMFSIEE